MATSDGGWGATPAWWRSAVIYQIYPRSFADADGDGVGDLAGVTQHLDHLVWLGVDAIWLNPIHPSPNADWGYDVADYLSIDPVFGDLQSFDRLVEAAAGKGMRVLLDLVPNHTSDRHPWFVDARSSRSSRHRDWYVWADPRSDGSPPNNWRSIFDGPAWTLDDASGQFYLHNFLPEQPDLNWWNNGVRDAFDEILRFWFDRGVAGFRIDVAHALIKDERLRDNPPGAGPGGLDAVHNMNRPEVHDIYRDWRRLADTYDPARVLIGETWVEDVRDMARFYGDGSDELDLALNIPFLFARNVAEWRDVVGRTFAALPPSAWPLWTGSNHDQGRFATHWCDGDERRARGALLMLLTLPGTPILYYGDEIGMRNVDVPEASLRDPVGQRRWPAEPGRDPGRTPMQWSAEPGGGFTRGEPWLPIDAEGPNVADQLADPSSMLHLCRDTIALRRERADLRDGRYAEVDAGPDVWAWRRGTGTIAMINGTGDAARADVGVAGTVAISTERARDSSAVDGQMQLEPWEALILETR
jgi:alpha-glucosidase